MSSPNRLKPTCNRKNCTRIATRRPILHCWAVADGKTRLPSRRASIEIGIACCERHAAEMSDPERWFITEETWPIIALTFKTKGAAEPNRASLEVEWIKVATIQ